eukprot:873192-Amphidinium_carterae.1
MPRSELQLLVKTSDAQGPREKSNKKHTISCIKVFERLQHQGGQTLLVVRSCARACARVASVWVSVCVGA